MRRILIILCLILFVGCGSKQSEYSSERFDDIRKMQIVFGSRNFEKSMKMAEKLLHEGVKTGDVYYYYASSLQHIKGDKIVNLSKEDKVKVLESYQQAIKWFMLHKSEFPKDNNQDKTFYNLGIFFYSEDGNWKVKELEKVKAIWDIGLKANPSNPYVKKAYPKLISLLTYLKTNKLIDEFLQALDDAKTKDQIESIAKKYRKPIKASGLDKVEPIQHEFYELNLGVLTEFDNIIQKKIDSL